MAMSVYELFKQDQEYQNFIHEFDRKVARFKQMSDQGIYNKEHLNTVSIQLQSELTNFISNHHAERFNKVKSDMERLEKNKKAIGYTERQPEAKEFEMQFKLSSDSELKGIVQDLNTTDILELNLLRMELKDRKFDDYDQQVKNFIAINDINGMDEIEKKEYNRLREQLGIYGTLGTRNVVREERLQPVQTITDTLTQILNNTNGNSKIQRSVDVDSFKIVK